jgi:hypothetical protein
VQYKGQNLGCTLIIDAFTPLSELNLALFGRLASHDYTAKLAMLGRILSIMAARSPLSYSRDPVCIVEIITRSLVPDSQTGRFEQCVAPEMMRRVDQPDRFASDVRSMIDPIPQHQSIQSTCRSVGGLLHLSPPVSPWSSDSLSIRQQQLIGVTGLMQALKFAIDHSCGIMPRLGALMC